MEKLLKDKKVLIIGGVVVLVIVVLLVVFSFGATKGTSSKNQNKESLDTVLTDLGKKFYEEHYYNSLDDKTKLANFQESGLNISLTNLDVIMPITDEVKTKLNAKKCDMDKTKVLIYPKNPYGAKDYTIKVELTCNK